MNLFFIILMLYNYTNCITDIGAQSPLRNPVRIMRVYPPGRSWYLSANVENSFCTAFALFPKKANAWRLLCRVSVLLRVTSFSTTGLISFDFGTVVVTDSCSISEIARLRSRDLRCFVFLPNLRPLILCFI